MAAHVGKEMSREGIAANFGSGSWVSTDVGSRLTGAARLGQSLNLYCRCGNWIQARAKPTHEAVWQSDRD